jgi:hypothetical protein
VTASLLIGKLQVSPRGDALARTLEEYGRVAKTLFVLRYLGCEAYRRRIGVQLNKGEALHPPRRFLFFAHQGHVRRSQSEDQANQTSCLNLVINAVIAWNTVYMGAVIDRLKARGERIDPRASCISRRPGTATSTRTGSSSSASIAGPARRPCDPSRCEPCSHTEHWFLSVCYRNRIHGPASLAVHDGEKGRMVDSANLLD